MIQIRPNKSVIRKAAECLIFTLMLAAVLPRPCALALEPEKPSATLSSGPRLARIEAKDTVLANLAAGEVLLSDTPKYKWVTIPPALQGFQFTKCKATEPTLRFKVLTDGRVYLACTNRFFGIESKDSWTATAFTEEKLKKKGWHKERNIEVISDEPEMGYWVYSRTCRAGDEFSIRNEKYRSPMLLVK